MFDSMLYETLKWPQIAPFCISSKKIPDPLPPPLKNYGMHTIKRQLRPCNIKLKIKYFKVALAAILTKKIMFWKLVNSWWNKGNYYIRLYFTVFLLARSNTRDIPFSNILIIVHLNAIDHLKKINYKFV